MSKEKHKYLQHGKSIDQNQKAMVNQQQITAFSGPLPHPADLEHYNRILPGAAERIIAMAEKQSRHRQDLESKVIVSDIISSRLGLIFGFIVGLGGIISGAIIIILSGQIVGGLISFTSLAALVGVFVYGSQQRRKEREQKRIKYLQEKDNK